MNPYEILNVSENSSDEEIKKAYRSLAKKYHPDMNSDDPSAEEKFKEINEAYDKINSQEKRNEYQNRNNFDSYYNYGFSSSDFNTDDLNDLFNNIRRKQQTYKSRRNTDLYLNYRISLADVCNGKESDVSYQINDNGSLIDVDFTIKIPKGIEEGMKLCFSGKGNKENSNIPPGDLYVSVSVIPDQTFNRISKLDLSYTATINYLDGLTGGSFDLELLNGRKVRVKYSPMCGPGTVMKMAGCGIEIDEHTKGNVYINFNVIPVELTDEQIESIKMLRVNENI